MYKYVFITFVIRLNTVTNIDLPPITSLKLQSEENFFLYIDFEFIRTCRSFYILINKDTSYLHSFKIKNEKI